MKKTHNSINILKMTILICLLSLNTIILQAYANGTFPNSGFEVSTDPFDFTDIRNMMGYVRSSGDQVQIVVGLPEDTSMDKYSQFASYISDIGGEIAKTVSIRNTPIAIIVNVPVDSVASFSSELKAAKQPRYVELNFKYNLFFTPNDPYWSLQWAPGKIQADWAWNTTLGSPNVLVAIVDTGVDYNHPDLAANYVPLGYDWVNNDNDPLDDYGHGTHCAGIVAAVINNSIGIAGTAQVQFMAEKALGTGGGYEDDLSNAIIHAADQGADIISMSWGGYMYSSLIHDAIKYAYDNGALLVAAAGNEACPGRSYPAAYKEVIAVAATDENDQPATFTNYGDWIELAAPGVNIYSTMPTYWVTMNNYGIQMNYDYLNGTSMACPHVAGSAALILSQYPSMSGNQLRYYLRYTADDLGDTGYDESYGYGRINARNSMEQGLPDHDLILVKWDRPPYVKPGLTKINATVHNFGALDEATVQVQLLANSTLYGTKTISLLASGETTTVTWNWYPQLGKLYNLTVHIIPKSGEISLENNIDSAWVGPETGIIKVPDYYQHIQDAVDAASPGDQIFVASGTYKEVISVYKTKLSFLGENRWKTIIDGCEGCFWGFAIAADETLVSRFTVKNTYKKIGIPCSGIILSGSSNNTIIDNYVTNNFEGIYLYGSSENTILRNKVTASQDAGIAGLAVSNNKISENIVTSNIQWGIILLLGANYNHIFNNTVSYTKDYAAIGVVLGSENRIIDNNVLSNLGEGYEPGLFGFSLEISNCGNSIVKENYVYNNTRGIYTGFGNRNNRIYHNNLINNTDQAGKDPDASDIWSDRWQCEGNYWADYIGEDQDNDGVGDTNLPHQGVDNYPLLSVWYTSDINHDGWTDILDIATIAIAFNSTPGDPKWNPHADVNQDGIIDYGDLNLTVPEYGMTWQDWWNKKLTVRARDPADNLLTNLQVWIDGKSVGYTGESFTQLKGMHEIQVQPTYSNGTNNFTFSHWEDDSTENPRILMLNTTKTVTAHYKLLNTPPNIPSTPQGPNSGYVYTTYAYTTSTTDAENDNVYYEFSWDDGTFTTVGPYQQGEDASASHKWTRPGTYQVTVRAQDIHGAWSSWSSSLEVNINQNDAGSGGDAGNNFSAANYISTGVTYKGTLYEADPLDTQDWYKFYAAYGKTIYATMTPPSGVDFDLQLYDPNGNLRASSKKAAGYPESISFSADLSGYWRIHVYIFDGEGQYSFRVSVYTPGGCPYLYTYDGKEYVCEGLLNIHNPEGIDVIAEHTLITTPKRVKGTYQLRLIEHPQTDSNIDCVKLYAILEDKTMIELHLISAVHSEYGNVLPQLLFSDEWKTETIGADNNNGTSQSIDLRFQALPPNVEVIGFFLVIEGNNWIVKI